MTSSYLRKHRRELDEALKERGMNRDSVGMPYWDEPDGVSTKSSGLGESGWFVLGISALLICGVLIAALAMPDPYLVERGTSEDIFDIAPASGATNQTGNRYKHVIPYLPDPGMPSVPQAGTLQPVE